MKKSVISTLKLISYLLIFLFSAISCITEEIDPIEDEAVDPIVGKWFLVKVNDTEVADVECYNSSFIESDAKRITFFIQDRLENGDCDTVLNNSGDLTVRDDFYYLGEEAIEIYIAGDKLTWRVDLETNLEFKK